MSSDHADGTRADRAPSAGVLTPSARRRCARILRDGIMPPYPVPSYRVIRRGWLSRLTLSLSSLYTGKLMFPMNVVLSVLQSTFGLKYDLDSPVCFLTGHL